jgi:hypothetical protein
VRREIVLVLILFTAIARLLLDYVHSRRASKETIFTYPAFFWLTRGVWSRSILG